MAEVALLGTGRMGAAMARRVALAGHDLRVWNRSTDSAKAVADSLPEHDVTVAATAADAVRGAEVVLSMLASGPVTCDVLLDSEVVSALAVGTVVCDLGTSGVDHVVRLAAGLSEVGVAVVDAPVSGSVPAVTAGTLLVMAAGDLGAISTVEPVLLSFARLVLRVGDVGAGQAMKLAVNLVVHDLNAAVSESLVLAERAGISPEAAYDVLEESVVGAPFVKYKRQAFLDDATPVAMSLDLVRKDLNLINEFAAQLNVEAGLTHAAERTVGLACDAGFGDQDMAALRRYLRTAD